MYTMLTCPTLVYHLACLVLLQFWTQYLGRVVTEVTGWQWLRGDA